MQSNNGLMKTVIITAVLAAVLIIIGMMMSSRANAPIFHDPMNPNTAEGNGQAELDRINASSSVDSDMDAYLKASNSVPNPNDFNDSYSDINQ